METEHNEENWPVLRSLATHFWWISYSILLKILQLGTVLKL